MVAQFSLSSLSDSCAHAIVCWDISQSAGAFATLTGVLAGFIVSAIIFSLQDRKGRHISLPLYSSSVACLSLALSSFLFSMLVGIDTESTASRSLAYILGSAAFGTFSISVVLLMLSIIWFFIVYDIYSTIVRGLKMLFRLMLATGILYSCKFSIDVLRIKAGDAQEHPWVFLILFGYGLYAYIVSRAGIKFIKNQQNPDNGRLNIPLSWKAYSALVNQIKQKLDLPQLRLEELALIVVSTSTGIFIISVTLVYGLLAFDFINWLPSFNSLNFTFYLVATILIYLLSPLFLIMVAMSLPDSKSNAMRVHVASKTDKLAVLDD